MTQIYSTYYKSPIGLIEITGNAEGIHSLYFVEDKIDNIDNPIHESLASCIKQLNEYFNNTRQVFDLKLKLNGTEFQKKVWNELLKIPYGKTVSYRDIATALGDYKAVRAVGGANGKNKISIIIPCHRVIGSNGTLTGYAGGLTRKEWLLNHEKM